jgi:YggT family protein
VLIILQLAWTVVFFFFIALIIRLVLDWIQVFARDWRPSGVVLILAEVVYSITDPPIKALRRVLPSLRLGSIAIDLSFLVVFFACSILLRVLPSW